MPILRHGTTSGHEGFVLLKTLIFTIAMLLVCCTIMISASFLIKRIAVQQEKAIQLIDWLNKGVDDALE